MQQRPILPHPGGCRSDSGSVIVLLLILLAMAAGATWYLFRARNQNEQAVRTFAAQAADRIMLRQDTRFVDFHLSSDAQVRYPPSWRERLFGRIRDLGMPDTQQLELGGRVLFTSHFFEPRGEFKAGTTYQGRPAYLTMSISRHGALWQIDALNLTWTPPVNAAAPEAAGDLPPPPENTPKFIPEPAPVRKNPRRGRNTRERKGRSAQQTLRPVGSGHPSQKNFTGLSISGCRLWWTGQPSAALSRS